MSTTPTDYGEPWRIDLQSRQAITDRNDAAVLFGYEFDINDFHLGRIQDCVNACSGIPDPAAAIQAARETLAGYAAWFEGMHKSGLAVPLLRTIEKGEAALALLTPTPPTKQI